ncbi:MAG: hypothetical protein H0W01_16465 [Pseudonocardiales bacterium]|nr:hypothetical protein [Pseudonocardiales bacterium]
MDEASETTVLVCSPQLDKLGALLAEHGWENRSDGEDALLVSGKSTDDVGELAGAVQIVLHEVATQRGSLEEAFMQMTGQDVEFRSEIAELVAVQGGTP